ncbi:hydrogenase maturation protease [Pyrofollis japonicus]|nr:hydrogenase maturation protease [Pyrofollis japonicus]
MAKPRILVFGTGNTFYGDDGIGYCLVKALEKCVKSLGTDLVSIQALNPGHATLLEGYDYAIFLDAYIDPEAPKDADIVVHELDPSLLDEADIVLAIEGIEPHSLDPLKLLVLARGASLFSGKGFLIGIRPEIIDFNKPLSKEVKERGIKAIKKLAEILGNLGLELTIDYECVKSFLDEKCNGPLLD